jgi:tetratricopeptide (TPR) repeat protein
VPSLNIVMIVKNEAACLADCLASIQPIADAIVIGDTGSTDDTMSIAHSFGAEVFEVEWRDDFAYARNCVLARAQGDWLLHMDADEVVDPDGASAIRALVDADGHGAQGVWTYLANYCDKPSYWRWTPAPPDDPFARGYAGSMRVPLVRLFKNGLGIEYREAVHENLGASLKEIDATLRDSSITIHHYGFDSDTKRSEEKMRYYLELARAKVETHPNDAKAWFDLAAAATICDETGLAEESAMKALALDPGYLDAAYALCGARIQVLDYPGAEAALEGIVLQGDTPPHFAAVLGTLATVKGDYDSALEWLGKAIETDPKNILAYGFRARAHDQMGNIARAKDDIARARAIAPSLEEYQNRERAMTLREEGEGQFSEGDHVRALATFVAALKADPEDPILHNNAGVTLNILGQTEDALASFSRALKLAPCMPLALSNYEALHSDPSRQE